MQKTIEIPDFLGTVQVKRETGFLKVGSIKLYVQQERTGNQPDLKGYIGIEGKFYEVSLWKQQ